MSFANVQKKEKNRGVSKGRVFLSSCARARERERERERKKKENLVVLILKMKVSRSTYTL